MDRTVARIGTRLTVCVRAGIKIDPQRAEVFPVAFEVVQPLIIKRRRIDMRVVFILPLLVIASGERLGVVDFYAKSNRRWSAVSPREFGVGLTAAGEDEHHGPVAVTKDALKRFHIDLAGLGRFTGVRVDPDPAALLRATAEINLLLEMLGDSHIIEGDVRLGAALLD